MSDDQFDAILRHTLEDFRVSRGEKRILQSTLEELHADEQDLALYRHRAFEIARNELMSPEAKAVLDWLEDVNKVLKPPQTKSDLPESQAYFTPGDDCPRHLIRMLGETRQKLDICVFTITDNRVSDAIVDAYDRKVQVRIISDDDKAQDVGSDVERFKRLGIPVRSDAAQSHMHHKFAVMDNKKLLTGSYNWTRSASEYNEENILVPHDPRLVERFARVFEQLWKKFG